MTGRYEPEVRALCALHRIRRPETEYVFAPPRKWRYDFAWPAERIALEVEGGVFIAGRHSRGAGMLKDMEKYNRAAVLGWRVLRCTPQTLPSGVEAVAACNVAAPLQRTP